MPKKRLQASPTKLKKSLFAFRPRLNLHEFTGLPLMVCAFMLGRATILGSIAPFGLATYAAVRGMAPKKAPATMLFIALGHISLGLGPETFLRIVLLVAYAAMLASARFRGPVAGALGVFALVLVVRGGLTLLTSGVDAYVLVLTGFEAVLAALLVIIFSYGLPVVADHQTGLRKASPEEISCAVAFLVAIIAGVGDASLGSLMLRNVAASFMTMGLGLAGGIGLGAAAGATCGVISGLPSGLLPTSAGVFALGGLLGGAFRIFGKPGVAVGFLLGSLGLVLQTTTPASLGVAVSEHLLASIFFLVAPASLFIGLARRTDIGRSQREPEVLQLRAALAHRLQDLSQAFREVGQVVEQTAAASALANDGGQRHTFAKLASHICDSCSERGMCRVTGEGLFDWLVLAELNNGIRKEHLPKEVRLRCPQADDIMVTTNHLLELARFSQSWQRRVAESREVAFGQMASLAKVLDRIASEVIEEKERPLQQRNHLIGFEAGIARMNKEGSIISGDSFLATELDDDRLLVVLSDGMGSGPRAAMESKAVISLLERLLSCGFERDATIHFINSIMLLKSVDEVYTTIDLLLLDMVSGKGEFIKIGAMPTFMRRGDEFSLIRGNGLPVGIVDQFSVDVVERFLVPGDILVMTTDGLFAGLQQGANGHNWISTAMARTRSYHPKEIAELLVERSLGHRHEPADDTSVIVIRLTDNQGIKGPLSG